MDYRVEVKMSQGGLVNETFAVRRFIADGFNKPVGAQPAEMACVLDDEALPHECQLTFEVRAADCFGNLSRPITLGPVKLKGIVVRW